jgi:hypothetical protein
LADCYLAVPEPMTLMTGFLPQSQSLFQDSAKSEEINLLSVNRKEKKKMLRKLKIQAEIMFHEMNVN